MNLAICGDPVISRALVLILQGPEFDVRFLPASSLDEVRTLEGVQILLLAPGWANVRREVSVIECGVKMPILELATYEERERWPRLPARIRRRVPWPCSTEELMRHIKATVASNPNLDGDFVAEIK